MADEKQNDLISRSALIAEYDRVHIGPPGGARKLMEDAPTVDAVEVVRCEKCLYRSQYCDENGLYKCGGLQTEDGDLVLMVKPDFFCAFGERRGAKMDLKGE